MAATKSVYQAVSRETVIERLHQAVAELKECIPVDSVYLYGSYARNEARRFSDVDVVVISPSFGHNIIEETVMLMEIFEKTGLMVEPRAYSREELAEAYPGSFLSEEVINKGIRID